VQEFTPEFLARGLTTYVVLLFSLSVHESAHGWTAWKMGDDTAVSQGRVSLNPLVHIDPIGTVLIPILQIFYGGMLLGWAKPTPVGAHNFKRLARGHILVAGAGPFSNLLLALLFTLALGFAVHLTGEHRGPLIALLGTGVQMNIALALFNLVPLPPLDGSWIASWGLPREVAAQYDRFMEPYGQWILLLLFVTGILGTILAPLLIAITSVLSSLVG